MAWYQVKGNENDVVFSSRIRFARNLEGYAFAPRLSDEAAGEIVAKVEAALGSDYIKNDMRSLSPLTVQALVEQHQISRDFAKASGTRALFCNANKSISVMSCEEDHIRLQCILPGLALRDAYRFACECDERLDAALPLAFDEELGYLTHCPTNLGTGLRASVMLHLPALTERNMIAALSHELAKIGLTMRGLYGEGSRAQGCLYQISNQVTLGTSEEEILHKLEEAVQSIIEKERTLRAKVSTEVAARRADRIHRALGVAKHAKLISSEEFFTLFTDLKLGVCLGELPALTHEALHALLIHTLPATLCTQANEPNAGDLERDGMRAALIHEAMEDSHV